MSDDIRTRPARPEDASDLARIYDPFVCGTVVTFEEESVPAEAMAERLAETLGVGLPWLVAEVGEKVVGYAHASAWKGRCAYRRSVEVTVYVDPELPRRGIGSRLYGALLEELARLGYHTAIGGIALPNDASEALHAKLGFEKVAHFREVGFKLGRYVDVAYWQKILEKTE